MKEYTYKKIQLMRESLTEEAKLSFPSITVEVLILVEHRLQTAIMAGLFDDDVDMKKTIQYE
jgi:hypothetical protein